MEIDCENSINRKTYYMMNDIWKIFVIKFKQTDLSKHHIYTLLSCVVFFCYSVSSLEMVKNYTMIFV